MDVGGFVYFFQDLMIVTRVNVGCAESRDVLGGFYC